MLDAELSRLVFPESEVPTYHLRFVSSDEAVTEWTWTPREGLQLGLVGQRTAILEIQQKAIEALMTGASPVEVFQQRLVRVGGVSVDVAALRELWADEEMVVAANVGRARSALSTAAKKARVRELKEKLSGEGASVGRVLRMLDRWAEHATSSCELDMLTSFEIEGLAHRPWHDPGEVPFDAIMNEAWPELRREAEVFLSGQLSAPHYGGKEQDPDTPLAGNPKGWRHWNLFEYFARRPGAGERFPAATRVMERIAREHTIVHGGFLILEPGVAIEPHSDGAGWCLSYHFGLIVPEGCHQTVAGERRYHGERASMLFEDCYVHSAANESADWRVIFNAVIANPQLDAAERRAIQQISADLPRDTLVYAV